MTTCVNTLWRVYVTSLTVFVSTMRFHIEVMFILKAIKSHLKGHMINRILHSWSFHMKCMKLAKARFKNFICNEHLRKILYVHLEKHH